MLYFQARLAAAALLLALICTQGYTQTAQPSATLPNSLSQEGNTAHVGHDGSHDFDFLLGTWKVHIRQRVNPLEGEAKWIDLNGTSITHTVWGGKANVDEVELDGPTGHKESSTLRLYRPETRQWSLYWASSREGVLQQPPMIGEFTDGKGIFYDGELFRGRQIYVRDVWSEITPDSAHFEQSFSIDGGKTWEPNWVASLTRIGG